MTLTFYKQAATPNRVDKTNYLTSQGDLSNVIIKDETNLMTPTFILKTNPLVYNANYVYCDFTSRYYYIDSIDALPGARIAIHCKIDVLYTYKNEILGSSAWVSRGPYDANMKYLHNDYPFQQNYKIYAKDFVSDDNPFDFTLSGDPTVDANIRNTLVILK